MRIWKQCLIVAAVFIAGLFVFEKLTNHETQDLTTDMAEASLPVVYLIVGEEQVNELHGYTTQMDAASVRDTITPVESGSVLPISVDLYGSEITSISYEVRSLDTTRLVQQSEAGNLSASDDTATADLTILHAGKLTIHKNRGVFLFFISRTIPELCRLIHIQNRCSGLRLLCRLKPDKLFQVLLPVFQMLFNILHRLIRDHRRIHINHGAAVLANGNIIPDFNMNFSFYFPSAHRTNVFFTE